MDDRQRRQLRDHLIVALDVDSGEAAIELVEALGDRVDYYKVGPRLFTRLGPKLLDDLSAAGADELFVDIKLHDIPNTVEGAVEVLAERRDVAMVTLHASGGREMIRRAGDAAGEELAVIAVTAMTSLDGRDVREVTGGLELEEWAERLATLAVEAGADGLVCSAREVASFRREYGPEPILVTPGIRPEWAASDDQKRTVAPAEALAAGSDRLVVGRPIYRAEDPVEAVERIGSTLGAHR